MPFKHLHEAACDTQKQNMQKIRRTFTMLMVYDNLQMLSIALFYPFKCIAIDIYECSQYLHLNEAYSYRNTKTSNHAGFTQDTNSGFQSESPVLVFLFVLHHAY